MRKAVRFANYAARYAMSGGNTERCIEPLPQDKRFAAAEWQRWPYNFIYQGFLLQQQWWHNATTGVRGLSKQHENMVEFTSRQLLDMVSPSNFLATNPELLSKTLSSGGGNLLQGWQNFVEDWERAVSGKKPVGSEQFVVGRDVAVDPRQGGLSQPPDRAHPICAGHRQGAARADPDRAGLDHEILHPRSVAA